MSCTECQGLRPHWPFPWPEPAGSAYADTGPGEVVVEFEHGGHKFRVSPTGLDGFNSGRRRYKSECLTCGMVLHGASTSAYSWIRIHLVPASKLSVDSAQPTLFDPVAGEAGKREGMERVAHHNTSLLIALIDAANAVRNRMTEFTSDDVWAEVATRGPIPSGEPRAMGAALATLAKHGAIASTKVYRKSTQAANHRRPVLVWRSTKP